mmetsp:Transcript_5869/g.9874  ORF Transcript_5869/g.9874 Transcript_5869/m.9874 type:complete len:270 (-) Transcript_5869:128-937(-)
MISIAALLPLLLFVTYPQTTQSFTSGGLTKQRNKTIIKMGGWSETWKDILNGGPKRWKVDDVEAKQKALTHITDATSTSSDTPLRILCPLAGDDQFVHYAWSQGHDVAAIDIVPDALKAMRFQFGENNKEDWASSTSNNNGGGVVWKHKSGRATLYEGDMLMKRPELQSSFDVVYDKDSFGALSLEMRQPYCQRLSEFTKSNGIVYVEVKNKESGREFGPPYHVEKNDLMEETSFGGAFDYVNALGEVYPLNMGGMRQMGHILRRGLRK